MFCTDNPIEDFSRYDTMQEIQIARLPVCSNCDQSIQQDTAVKIGDEWFCDSCLNYMRYVVET